MRTESDDYKMTPLEAVMKYVGIAVAIIYVGMGIAIALRSRELFSIPENYSFALGGLLIAYGIYRGYRVFSKYFHK
jgi:hypothetical protein